MSGTGSRRRLFAARDRFGEKPFFYTARPGFFAFASELSALIRHPAVDRTIDPRALQKFFAYGYIPAPNALYRGTRKLPGGCSLTLDLADFSVRERRYWRFAIEADEHAPDDRVPELAEELRALLDRAVARRLVSDVPLGVFLSGGINSSTVLALAARHRTPGSLDTFTIGFNEASFDETPLCAGSRRSYRHAPSRTDPGFRHGARSRRRGSCPARRADRRRLHPAHLYAVRLRARNGYRGAIGRWRR